MSLQDTYKPEDKDFKPVWELQQAHILPLAIHERRCNFEKDFDPLAHKSKQICIFIEQKEYNHILGDAKAFRIYLDGVIEQHPKLFPVMIRQGYTFHDILPESKKMPEIRLRRIKVRMKDGNGNDVFTIRFCNAIYDRLHR
ncbi:MAG: hypothetical protein C5S48_01405 [Candidatus Methanogaster sp.]|nr:MAG: hypothetical protein C5S48_01405 [ANME-2 cluster archaeon]